MKINDAGKKPIEGAHRPTQAHASRDVAKSETAAPSDSVKLSAQSQAFAGVVSAGGPVFDAKKVADIKAAIANGTFKVNPERIADGLIDTARDLIHQRKA